MAGLPRPGRPALRPRPSRAPTDRPRRCPAARPAVQGVSLMQRQLPVAPIVARAEETLEHLAHAISADHEASEEAGMEAVRRARDAGEKLLRAKGMVKHGRWLPGLKNRAKIEQKTAWRYMQIALRWDELKLGTVPNLADAYRLLSADGEEEEPPRENEYVTLSRWKAMNAAERRAALAPEDFAKRFNGQGENENIE